MIRAIIEKVLKVEKEELSSIIRDAVYIIIFSVILGFAVNLFNPKGFIFIGKTVLKRNNIVLITGEEAKIKKENASVIFIDARQSDEFDISHIPGAINIPAVPASISVKKINENLDILSKPKELVLYCDGLSCGSSQILAETLIGMGYSKHIYIIKNGIPEWEATGLTIERPVKKPDAGSKE
jgi:rhodanese-related sulfurtransferase